MNAEYSKYLLSPEWGLIRQRLFTERGKKCERCSSNKILQIHHLTYERIFKEEMSDLLILCKKCHEKEHRIDKPKKEKRRKPVYNPNTPKGVVFTKKREMYLKKPPLNKVFNKKKNGRYKKEIDFRSACTQARNKHLRYGIPIPEFLY